MRLESLTASGGNGSYTYKIGKTIKVDGMIRELTEDITNGLDNSRIATKFHNTIISIIFDAVKSISKREKKVKVVLSGGVFQNKYLLEGTILLLKKSGFMVYANEQVPANDGGIALGQIIIAGKRRSMRCV